LWEERLFFLLDEPKKMKVRERKRRQQQWFEETLVETWWEKFGWSWVEAQ